VECNSVAKTQALFDKLVNGIVTAINDIFSPLTSEVPEGVTTYTDSSGNVYNASEVKILDTSTSTGDDGKMPPEELFSRNYTERFIEVTGDDGNTYYVYNEKNTFGSESLYTLSNIEMNQTIMEDYSKLPFKTKEGDNDMQKGADLVAKWNENVMNLDPSNMSKLNFKDYYRQMIYTIGNTGNLYEAIASNQETTTSQIDDTRTQITGVSSEEELTNMIKYQSAYNAASRYVTTISDMLEYIIERLGA
jgi:flagellar hook-associated protein 1 FlgK